MDPTHLTPMTLALLALLTLIVLAAFAMTVGADSRHGFADGWNDRQVPDL